MFVASKSFGMNWVGLVVGSLVCSSALPLLQISHGVSWAARAPSR